MMKAGNFCDCLECRSSPNPENREKIIGVKYGNQGMGKQSRQETKI